MVKISGSLLTHDTSLIVFGYSTVLGWVAGAASILLTYFMGYVYDNFVFCFLLES